MDRLALGATTGITFVVIAFLVAMILTAQPGAPDGPAPSPREIEETLRGARPPAVVAPSGLAIPVAGVGADQLRDTFRAARSGGRVHDAIDIMAPAGTPVVAAAGGTVEKLFYNHGGGGISAYVRSRDRRFVYYYAHLQRYAAGLREGVAVARGDPIGMVGSTGNASAAGPHLHFAIHAMNEGERWWQGRAINPYPLLAGDGARR